MCLPVMPGPNYLDSRRFDSDSGVPPLARTTNVGQGSKGPKKPNTIARFCPQFKQNSARRTASEHMFRHRTNGLYIIDYQTLTGKKRERIGFRDPTRDLGDRARLWKSGTI